jgi:hypothetical protein
VPLLVARLRSERRHVARVVAPNVFAVEEEEALAVHHLHEDGEVCETVLGKQVTDTRVGVCVNAGVVSDAIVAQLNHLAEAERGRGAAVGGHCEERALNAAAHAQKNALWR